MSARYSTDYIRKQRTTDALKIRISCCRNKNDIDYVEALIESCCETGNLTKRDYDILKRELKEKKEELRFLDIID